MKKLLKIGAIVIIALIVIGFLFGGGKEEAAIHEMDKASQSLATDAEKQYEIAVSSGNEQDAYGQAEMAAQFYLNAKDEVNYKKWKDISKKHAKNLGIPEM